MSRTSDQKEKLLKVFQNLFQNQDLARQLSKLDFGLYQVTKKERFISLFFCLT